MSKRLQVVMDDAEYAAIEASATREGTSVSHWVRQTLREAREARPKAGIARKLAVVREAATHDAPTGPIEQLVEETQRGYLA